MISHKVKRLWVVLEIPATPRDLGGITTTNQQRGLKDWNLTDLCSLTCIEQRYRQQLYIGALGIAVKGAVGYTYVRKLRSRLLAYIRRQYQKYTDIPRLRGIAGIPRTTYTTTAALTETRLQPPAVVSLLRKRPRLSAHTSYTDLGDRIILSLHLHSCGQTYCSATKTPYT